MKYPCTIIFLATLLGQTLAANSKLNQNASITDDWYTALNPNLL